MISDSLRSSLGLANSQEVESACSGFLNRCLCSRRTLGKRSGPATPTQAEARQRTRDQRLNLSRPIKSLVDTFV
jgi:hypothetical protein